MSTRPDPSTRRTLRILVVAAVVGVLALGGLYGGWKLRKALMVRRALAVGLAAYAQGDWQTARLNLGRYISVHRDDGDVMMKYAHAQLAVRPVTTETVRQAMGAYREVLRLRPGDDEAFGRLALLYETTGNLGELSHIATRRLEVRPDDPAAIIAQAKDLIFREKRDTARAALEGLVARLTEQPRDRDCDEFVEACGLLVGLTTAPAGPDAWSQAIHWLDRAVARCPQSGLALVQRAARRQALAASQPADAAAQTAAAREDLERAEQLAELEPPVRLMLSEQWMILRQFDRAAAQLQAAKQAGWAALERFFVDPADWTAALFVQEAKLALLTEEREGGVELAEKALASLAEAGQRVTILPIAIELLVGGGQTGRARELLGEYVEQLKLRGRLAPGDEQLAWLRATIARGEQKPYEVIEHLAPVAAQGRARPAIHAMLAEAYMQTGQAGRAARLSEQSGTEAWTNPMLARLAGQAQIARGHWEAALRTLGSTTPEDAAEDPETEALRLAARLGAAYEKGAANPAAAAEIEATTQALAALRDRHRDMLLPRLLLATAAARSGGGLEKAEQELQRAVAECAEPLPAYRALARLYTTHGRLEEAQRTLEEACEACALQAAAWLALSDLLVTRQRVDEAEAALRRGLEAVTDASGQTALRRRAALLRLLEDDRAAAVATLKELASADPQDIQTRALLLELPEIGRDEAAARALVEEIKRAEGNTGVTWRLYEARLLLARPDWQSDREQAEAHLKYCLDADPGLAAAALLLGRMFEDLGDWAGAETTYANGFENSGVVELADRLLALYGRQRRYTSARDLLHKMQQVLGDQATSNRRLALDIVEQRYDSAVNELRARLTAADRDPADLVRLASVRYAQSRNAEPALRLLDEAAAGGAGAVEVARVRASILLDQGRTDETKVALDQLVAEHPSPEALLLRASYHQRLGDTAAAEQDYAALARSAENDYGVAVLGEFYAQSGQLGRAIEEWEAGLKAHPDSQTLRRGLAKAYLTRNEAGDRERADALLTALEKDFAQDMDLLWVRAVEAAQDESPTGRARARELLERGTHGSPARAEVYGGLGEVAMRLGEMGLARDLAARGLQFNPGETKLLLQQAQAELFMNQLDNARERARAALAADGKNVAALEILLVIASRQQDTAALRDGLARLEQHIAADPTAELLQVLRARAQTSIGETDRAREALTAFCDTEAGRKSVAALLTLQDLQRQAKDFAAAERTLEAAGALDAGHPGVLHGRIMLLAERQRYDEVVKLMQTAAIEKRHADVLLSAAHALSASPAHVAAAVDLCRRAAALVPRNADALLTLGDFEYQRGNAAEALQAYRTVLEFEPLNPIAQNNLAWVLGESGTGLEEALVAARNAVVARPTDANFRDTLAFVLSRLGRFEEARAEYRRSAELNPPNSPQRARSLYKLAQVCVRLDNVTGNIMYVDTTAHRDWEAVSKSLRDVLAAENGQPVFAPQERAEIERLLAAGVSAGRP